MDSMGRYERTSDRMRPDGCTHTLLVRPREGQNLRDADESLPVGIPVTDEVARRPVGGDETRAANRAWWDGEADAAHGPPDRVEDVGCRRQRIRTSPPRAAPAPVRRSRPAVRGRDARPS